MLIELGVISDPSEIEKVTFIDPEAKKEMIDRFKMSVQQIVI